MLIPKEHCRPGRNHQSFEGSYHSSREEMRILVGDQQPQMSWLPSGRLTVCELENHHAIHGHINYFDWAILESSQAVGLPEARPPFPQSLGVPRMIPKRAEGLPGVGRAIGSHEVEDGPGAGSGAR